MHWLLFIHKILFSSICFEHQCSSSGGHSCIQAAYGNSTSLHGYCTTVPTSPFWVLSKPVGHSKVTSRRHQHDCTDIAQPNIPITTAPPRKYSQHTSPIFFFHKTIFQNVVGPFQGPQGLLPTIFEFPFSRYIPSNFFPPFDLNSHFLLHCIQPLMIILPPRDWPSQTGVTNLWAVTHTLPPLLPTSPLHLREAVDAYLQRHRYALTSTATPTPKLAEGGPHTTVVPGDTELQLNWKTVA